MRGFGVLFAAMALLLIGGATRLAYIQALQGEALRAQAERQQLSTRTIPARRGEILDTRGRVLAGTVRCPSVFVDPKIISDARFAAYSIGPLLGSDAAELERQIEDWRAEGRRFVWLKRRISEEQLAALGKVIAGRRLRAFDVRYEPARVYPQGPIAPQVLGFVGADTQGLAGIEAAWEERLRGTPGRTTATVDVGRRRVQTRGEGFAPAVDGASVVLTIDSYIQQVTQQALARAFEKHRPEWATAVVLDPHSGEVLAMASLPDFDPADAIPPGLADMSPEEQEAAKARWRNRCVSDSYEPGSIFKPYIACCALAEKMVGIDERFVINGPERAFGRRTIHDDHTYGVLSFYQVISKSSNIGMGLLGARCGSERLHRYVRAFGFGEPTGIMLPGEHPGLVLRLERWNKAYSPQSVPIGQEIAVTPIQLVTAFSVFCNGGLLLRPRIVRGVIGPDGQTLADYSEPIVVRRVLDAEVVEVFRRRALVDTVRDGTGTAAALENYQVFGKTGTAQIAGPGGAGYIHRAYVGSFIGGAPADVPRIVVLVSIYKPSKDGYYGGTVAAPAVKEIIAETLAYMRVPPELRTKD